MPLDKEFEQKLVQLGDLDHDLMNYLMSKDVNTEEIVVLVDTREQLLQSLFNMVEQSPDYAKHPKWHAAVQETQRIVELMQSKTDELSLALQKYRYGKKSVQQYKKFL
ncbi:flagellar protein FliT [Vibrio olivae]|uniref:Flagellar protein FliT n=1 Tax=Vibrio olivae TaxID=1243002 RepID=A0ABV5HKZ3_9VIBR